MKRPISTTDLLSSEMAFIGLMRALWYGRFENIPIRDGQIVLEPTPCAIQTLKFGCASPKREELPTEFVLNHQLADFFEQIRGIECGEILVLKIQAALPFSMDLSHQMECALE